MPGGQRVVGSNPAVPTIVGDSIKGLCSDAQAFFLFGCSVPAAFHALPEPAGQLTLAVSGEIQHARSWSLPHKVLRQHHLQQGHAELACHVTTAFAPVHAAA